MSHKAFGMDKRSILWYAYRMHARNPQYRKPIWLDVLMKNQPSPQVDSAATPKKIEFEEERLLRAYYKKNPMARDEVVDMESNVMKIPSAIFVKKQLELMRRRGLDEETAYDIIKFSEEKGKEQVESQQKAEQQTKVQQQRLLGRSLRNAFKEFSRAESDFWKKYEQVKRERR